jgi:hypothetical protein
MAVHVACMGEMINAYKILIGTPEGKRPIRRCRCRLGYNIRLDLREIGRDVVNWIHLAEDRDQRRAVVKTVMNIRVPLQVENLLTI